MQNLRCKRKIPNKWMAESTKTHRREWKCWRADLWFKKKKYRCRKNHYRISFNCLWGAGVPKLVVFCILPINYFAN